MAKSGWFQHRACAGLEPEYFFDDSGTIGTRVSPGSEARRYLAKRVCATCPVAVECLQLARAGKAEFGVFGGLDQRERHRLTDGQARRRDLAVVEVAIRLRWEGLGWREVAARLDMSVAEVRDLFDKNKRARTVTGALRNHAAWADVANGWPASAIASRYGIPSEDAEKMCQAMDKQPEYEGPRGRMRYATDVTETGRQAYARAS